MHRKTIIGAMSLTLLILLSGVAEAAEIGARLIQF